jgi:hypothetical protein
MLTVALVSNESIVSHSPNTAEVNEQQLQKMKAQPGFVAALDQSGGSTPSALAAFGD